MRRIILILTLCLVVTVLVVAAASCGNPAGDHAQSREHEEEQEKEQEEQPAQEPDAEEEDAMDMDEILDNITINTQSSIRIGGAKTIYVDPYKRSETPHDADLILITHAHYDHFDEPSLRNVANEETFVICPVAMENDLKRLDIGRGLTVMKAGSSETEPGELDGIAVEAVPAYNLNKNYHPKANGWLGYIITMDGVKYYAAGDTDALPELEDIDCDIAFVPVGGTYTMTADEAAGLVNRISPETAIPIHYGTIVGRAADADIFRSKLNDDIRTEIKVEDAE